MKDSWPYAVAKQAWDLSLEMHSDTGRDVKFRKSSDGSWHPQRLSIILNALKMGAATVIQTCAFVASNLTLLMVAVWATVRPKAYARSNQFY
ncbi:hypothetical protein SCYZ1_21 [Pseudomonas phage SCYZ1]|nr:hypothetical protein SCYZ1_21 [Pseudomonas phage SCYZ1]